MITTQGLLSLTVVVGALRFGNGGRWDSEKLTRLKNFFLQNFAKINQITFLNPQMVFQASKINVSWLCLERWHGSGYSKLAFRLIFILSLFTKNSFAASWNSQEFTKSRENSWRRGFQKEVRQIMVVINLLIIVITAPSRICLPRWT